MMENKDNEDECGGYHQANGKNKHTNERTNTFVHIKDDENTAKSKIIRHGV